jgi:hypothetical protein
VPVRQTIDELRRSLGQLTAEAELLGLISAGLETLRQAFRSDRSQFTPEDIDFLKSLSEVSEHLRAFVDARDEVPHLTAVDEYEEMMRRLRRVKDGLAGHAVVRRVGITIRELHERLPAILDQDQSRQEFRKFRAQFRILDLQVLPRRCPYGHTMVLREGLDELFWGCSQYPMCEATAQLTPEERAVAGGKS